MNNYKLKVFFSLAILLTFFSVIKLMAQDSGRVKRESKKKVTGTIYKEISLENFENFDMSQISTTIRGDLKVELEISHQNPAPLKDSRKYLGIQIHSDELGSVLINFKNPPGWQQYCRKLFIWVFGTQISGTLYAIIEDSLGNQHTVKFDSLNFRGWKKLSAPLGDHVVQKNFFIEENLKVKLIHLKYFPGPKNRHKKWQNFYIDDITAEVRERYLL